MGWFSGKASELHPMEGVAHSEAILELAGGPDKLAEKMEAALAGENHQWALELADVLLDTGNHTSLAKVGRHLRKLLQHPAKELVTSLQIGIYLCKKVVEKLMCVLPDH